MKNLFSFFMNFFANHFQLHISAYLLGIFWVPFMFQKCARKQPWTLNENQYISIDISLYVAIKKV